MGVFYSFHYTNDYWRVQQIRNIGAIDNIGSVASQEWEEVRYKSDTSIRNWIDEQMKYKRAVVVLIGSQTASRPWVRYEIKRAWDLRKPLLGIQIHGLKNQDGYTSHEGDNPFDSLGFPYSAWIPIFAPRGFDSKQKYADIRENLSYWISQGYTRP